MSKLKRKYYSRHPIPRAGKVRGREFDQAYKYIITKYLVSVVCVPSVYTRLNILSVSFLFQPLSD